MPKLCFASFLPSHSRQLRFRKSNLLASSVDRIALELNSQPQISPCLDTDWALPSSPSYRLAQRDGRASIVFILLGGP